jgi:hypothetical protein
VGLTLSQLQRPHERRAAECFVLFRHDAPPSPWPLAGPARPASDSS